MRFVAKTICAVLLSVSIGVGVLPTDAAPLNWQTADGFRVAKLTVSFSGKTGFSLLAPAMTGIHFTNTLPDSRKMTNVKVMNGSGVALGDYDGDGLCDIY